MLSYQHIFLGNETEQKCAMSDISFLVLKALNSMVQIVKFN